MSLNVFKGSPFRENVPFRVNVMKGLLIDKRSVRECLNGNAILYRPQALGVIFSDLKCYLALWMPAPKSA